MPIAALGEVAKLVKGEVLGDAGLEVSGIAGIDDVEYGEITWAEKEKFFTAAAESPASAVLLPKSVTAYPKPAVRVENPRLAFAILLEFFNPPRQFEAGIHPSAVVAEGVKVGEGAYIGPNCVIEEGATIGRRAVLYANVYVGLSTKVGDGCAIHPNVTIREGVQIGKNVVINAGTVIGSDGFGFVTTGGKHRKVPQVGGVTIGDDVEIGANCAIDRATTGMTVIAKGTKMDNLVQIAHNVCVGEDCLLVGQAGIAGSTKLKHHVTLAGHAGIAGHLNIGEHSIIGAMSGVMGDLPPKSFVSGIPARPLQEDLRGKASLRKLPELLKKVAALEKRVDELERCDAQLSIE